MSSDYDDEKNELVLKENELLLMENEMLFDEERKLSKKTVASANKRMLTLAERIAVIYQSEVTRNIKHLANMFGCGRTQIQNIIQNADSIIKDWNEDPDPYRVRRRTSEYLIAIGNITYEWLVRSWLHNQHITEYKILSVASELAKLMDYKDFKASRRWLTRFKSKFRLNNMEEQRKKCLSQKNTKKKHLTFASIAYDLRNALHENVKIALSKSLNINFYQMLTCGQNVTDSKVEIRTYTSKNLKRNKSSIDTCFTVSPKVPRVRSNNSNSNSVSSERAQSKTLTLTTSTMTSTSSSTSTSTPKLTLTSHPAKITFVPISSITPPIDSKNQLKDISQSISDEEEQPSLFADMATVSPTTTQLFKDVPKVTPGNSSVIKSFLLSTRPIAPSKQPTSCLLISPQPTITIQSTLPYIEPAKNVVKPKLVSIGSQTDKAVTQKSGLRVEEVKSLSPAAHLNMNPVPQKINTYEEALKYLQPFEEFVLLQANYRAIGLLDTIQNIIKDRITEVEQTKTKY